MSILSPAKVKEGEEVNEDWSDLEKEAYKVYPYDSEHRDRIIAFGLRCADAREAKLEHQLKKAIHALRMRKDRTAYEDECIETGEKSLKSGAK